MSANMFSHSPASRRGAFLCRTSNFSLSLLKPSLEGAVSASALNINSQEKPRPEKPGLILAIEQLLLAVLQGIQMIVFSLLAQQFLMVALLHNPALGKQDDIIRMLDLPAGGFGSVHTPSP